MPADSRPTAFSTEESFGLFMVAVRELQQYDDEATRSDSDPRRLESHLDEAFEALEHAHRLCVDDLLPRFYLGIALTMKNEREYAARLRDTAGYATEPLEEQVWPLLDRALDCFDRDEEYDPVPALKDSAQFNCANVYARLSGETNLDRAIAILDGLANSHATRRPPSVVDRLISIAESVSQRRRQADEAAAFAMSVGILRAYVGGMREIAAASARHVRWGGIAVSCHRGNPETRRVPADRGCLEGDCGSRRQTRRARGRADQTRRSDMFRRAHVAGR